MEECTTVIKTLEQNISSTRLTKSQYEKEINDSDKILSNVRDNERIRRLRKVIASDNEKIKSFDMEEAAKARRQFDEKYKAETKRAGDMEAEVCPLLPLEMIWVDFNLLPLWWSSIRVWAGNLAL